MGVILFKEIPIFCASKNLVKIVGHTMITYLAKDDDVKRISKILMTVVVLHHREVVRGVSGVSWDTPIFQDLLYKFQQKMFQKVYALT